MPNAIAIILTSEKASWTFSDLQPFDATRNNTTIYAKVASTVKIVMISPLGVQIQHVVEAQYYTPIGLCMFAFTRGLIY